MTETHDRAAAERIAEEVGQAMWARDHASQMLGIRMLEVGPGHARMEMQVQADMANSHRICHGGLIFTLADCAFAYACNSYNRNTVASACHIDFLAPANIGDVLVADAVERSAAGRTGVYDITVRNQGGATIALFRGKSYRINGDVIAGLQQAGHGKQ